MIIIDYWYALVYPKSKNDFSFDELVANLNYMVAIILVIIASGPHVGMLTKPTVNLAKSGHFKTVKG